MRRRRLICFPSSFREAGRDFGKPGYLSRMRTTFALAIALQVFASAAYAQTSDGGFDKLLSTSLA